MEDKQKGLEANALQWQEFAGTRNSNDCVSRKASALAQALTSQQVPVVMRILQSSEPLLGISKTDSRWWDVYYDFLILGIHIADREAFNYLGKHQNVFVEHLCRDVVETCNSDFMDDQQGAQFRAKFIENFGQFQEQFAGYRQVGRGHTTDFRTDHLNYAFAKRILSRFGLEQNLRHIVSVFSAAHALEILINIPSLLDDGLVDADAGCKDNAVPEEWQPYQPLEWYLTEHHRLQALPTSVKRGLFTFIQAHSIVELACKAMADNGHENADPAVREIASYVFSETVRQVWCYGPEGRPREGAKETLDTVACWFARRFAIPVEEKLAEYQQAEDPGLHLTGQLIKYDLPEPFYIGLSTASLVVPLIESIERAYTLTEDQMTQEIQRFFVNLVK